MLKNPHHRILALSATPGSDPERVQTIVDSLHISRIEIRNEQSMDVLRYMKQKVCFTVFLSWLLSSILIVCAASVCSILLNMSYKYRMDYHG